MPTGYTCGVGEGKIGTLRDYALTCARAFGALITLRDEPMDTPIPERLEPSTKYRDERLAAAQALLDQLPRLTAAECDARSASAFKEAMASHVRYLADKDAQKRRYETMLTKVRDWSTEAEGIRAFMIEQLETSIQHDTRWTPEPPVRLTGEQWREAELATASRDVAYHSVEREKEINRTEERNRWLQALRASLPQNDEGGES